jgi:hypothetical protein
MVQFPRFPLHGMPATRAREGAEYGKVHCQGAAIPAMSLLAREEQAGACDIPADNFCSAGFHRIKKRVDCATS